MGVSMNCPRCERLLEWHPFEGTSCRDCGFALPDDDEADVQEDAPASPPTICSPEDRLLKKAIAFYEEGRFSRALKAIRRASNLCSRGSSRSRLHKRINQAADNFMMEMASLRTAREREEARVEQQQVLKAIIVD